MVRPFIKSHSNGMTIWEITDEYIAKIKQSMPELPYDRKNRYMNEFGLPKQDAETLTSSVNITNFFEECLKLKNDPKSVCNWIATDVMRKLKDSLEEEPTIQISAKNFVNLINMFQNKEISINNARVLLDRAWETDEDVVMLANELGLKQDNSEDSAKEFVLKAIEENPNAVADYKSGNQKAITFLMGQVMKMSKGKVNPQIVGKLLSEELNK